MIPRLRPEIHKQARRVTDESPSQLTTSGSKGPSQPRFKEAASAIDEPVSPITATSASLRQAAKVFARSSGAANRVTRLQIQIAEQESALRDAAQELQVASRIRADLESQLLQARKLEAIGQLTSSVAHDFNNILSAIVGSYGLIRRRTTSPQVLHLVTLGEQAASRATKLTDRLLMFARHEDPVPELLDLPAVLQDLEGLIRHSIRIDTKCRLEIPVVLWNVLTDANQLGMALLNLAVNAQDAMPHDCGTLTIAARNLPGTETPAGLPPGDYVAVEVQDTGEGMTHETLSKAQDAFFTTKPRGKGTGLGLAMVRDFARQAGGGLQITSAPGAGTTVSILLPRAAVIPSTPDRMAALKAISAPGFALHGNANILLVDDNDQVRSLSATFLRDLGYHVTEAASAELAMVLMHASPQLDLLITDINLPGDDGAALARRLHTKQPGLPVLYLSGNRPETGYDHEQILLKPFQDTVLAKAVLEKLGRKVALDPAQAEPLLSRLSNPAMRAMLLDWHYSKASGAGFPPLASLDPIGYCLDANAFVVAVDQTEPCFFHYLSVGQALMDQLGITPGELPVAPDSKAEEIIGTLDGVYRRCARLAAPVYQSVDYDFGDDAPFHFKRLILPASENGQTITHLIGIVLFGAGTDKA